MTNRGIPNYNVRMEIVLVILSFLLLLAGLLGAVIPGLPGPPLGYAGLLLLQWSGHAGFSPAFLWLWAGIAAAVTIADYFLPAWMTKQFGGSRLAVVGSVLGLVIGILFFAPAGLLLGPFLGALAGELVSSRPRPKRGEASAEPDTAGDGGSRFAKALKVALGSFLAFILGTGAKLIVGLLMLFYAARAMFS